MGARFVARREHDPAIASGPDKNRLAAQRGIIELLNRRVERIHIGVSDNPGPTRS